MSAEEETRNLIEQLMVIVDKIIALGDMDAEALVEEIEYKLTE